MHIFMLTHAISGTMFCYSDYNSSGSSITTCRSASLIIFHRIGTLFFTNMKAIIFSFSFSVNFFLFLLHHMRQLMRQQPPPCCRLRVVLPPVKVNIQAVGKGFGVQALVHLHGVAAGMDAHLAEIAAEGAAHERIGLRGHRLAVALAAAELGSQSCCAEALPADGLAHQRVGLHLRLLFHRPLKPWRKRVHLSLNSGFFLLFHRPL